MFYENLRPIVFSLYFSVGVRLYFRDWRTHSVCRIATFCDAC